MHSTANRSCQIRAIASGRPSSVQTNVAPSAVPRTALGQRSTGSGCISRGRWSRGPDRGLYPRAAAHSRFPRSPPAWSRRVVAPLAARHAQQAERKAHQNGPLDKSRSLHGIPRIWPMSADELSIATIMTECLWRQLEVGLIKHRGLRLLDTPYDPDHELFRAHRSVPRPPLQCGQVAPATRGLAPVTGLSFTRPRIQVPRQHSNML